MTEIDPRIQERRIEILRAKGKRRLRVVLLTVSLLLLIAGAVAITKSSLLDVDEIMVKGAESELADFVQERANIQISTPLLEVDSKGAIERIKEIPQIKDARISKSFNGTLTVTVTQRNPVVAATDGSSWLLLDDEGRVVTRMLELPYGYPVVDGFAELPRLGEWVPEQALPAIHLAMNLPSILAANVSTIHAGDAIELILFGEGKILFGDTNNQSEKILAAATILEKANLDNLVHVDVRAPRNPVLCRSQDCSYAS
ncbi:MAG: FtsQ-type POTRA domain-containing protein [Acidimicrobiales bacterium]|nr:FtsQ-type POTRA domain-containing protein [Acidimicrobiales bacterium]MDP6299428.1 FtsQ-type POTRA domain-containing protein [Acidimicrobiales bacterium]HJM28102.1 FtsQ-type POTRA domain-containing protein [Acidimicrobiales bacterium]HJM96641.1 FtsQ-type POTRA domain-containing protein [Acidimicrobiales bacterium]